MKHVRLYPVLLLLSINTVPLTAADDAAGTLHDLFHREWESRLKSHPLFATSVGRHEYDDRLASVDPADLAREAATTKAFLGELAAIDRAKLSAED
ncbi:MAG TPA: DUF885 domain-containing protein, partial [Thermoanaerobaculia bacterium]|nr:DUF885 domain-containing protein [Thermoanaerobaculia bacterium]